MVDLMVSKHGALYWLVAILVGGFVGFGATLGGPAFGLAGLPLLISLLLRGSRPVVYGVLALIALASDGWNPSEPNYMNIFRVNFGRIYLMEWIGYAGIFLHLVRKVLAREQFCVPPHAKWPLLIAVCFALMMPLSAVLGLYLGNDTREALGYLEWRALFLSLLVYAVIVLENPRTEELYRYIWFYVAVVSLRGMHGIIKYLLGHGDYHPAVGTIVFIDSGVLVSMVACILLVTAMLGFGTHIKNVILLVAVLTPMGFSVVASLRRNVWVGLLAGLAVVGALLPGNRRLKMLVPVGFGAAAVMAFSDWWGSTVLGDRVMSTLSFLKNPDMVFAPADKNSLPFHVYDLLDAWNYIRKAPITGYGFGAHYVRILTAMTGVMGDEVIPNFVHNQYLHFWLKMGVMGLALYVGWIAVVIVHAVRRAKKLSHDNMDKPLLVGAVAFLVGSMAMQMWDASLIGQTKMPLLFAGAMAVATLSGTKHTEGSGDEQPAAQAGHCADQDLDAFRPPLGSAPS